MNCKLILAFMCLATIVFSMCADEGTNAESANSNETTTKDIMSNPSAYDGKTVLIKGVCSFSYQGRLSPCGKIINEKMTLGMGEPMNAGLGLDIADKTNVHMCVFKSTIPSPYPVMTDIEAEVKVIDGYPYLTNVLTKAVRDPYKK
jgi:hypothetical protein